MKSTGQLSLVVIFCPLFEPEVLKELEATQKQGKANWMAYSLLQKTGTQNYALWRFVVYIIC